MSMDEKEFLEGLDASQRPVVLAREGHHLVLAPPGCGKTHILAERVRWAHAHGMDFGDMLCLTFTNRAARGMTNRIGEVMAGEDISGLQVGNVHRFCSRFLFEQEVVPADSSIIDDEECVSILAEYKNDDEERVLRDYHANKNYQQIIFFSHLMQQMQHGHPWRLYLHPESLTEADREALRHICKMQKWEYSVDALLTIYPHAEDYLDDADTAPYDVAGKVRTLLDKMRYARRYAEYKEANHMIDFEDLLLLTYDAYMADKEMRLRRYRWIQVDEVQDLNSMQLAIIDLLTAADHPTVVYLGDEQQAIFSFMGAKVERLTEMKLRCKGNIHHLRKNHRAPGYLLKVLNDYAEKQLAIDRELLPMAGNDGKAQPGDLQIIYGSTINDEVRLVSEKVRELTGKGETTAVIVSSNADANKISLSLAADGIRHFKVSGRDLFETADVRLLFAHLSVLANEHNFISWARVMRGVKAFDTSSLARRFERKLIQLAISPADLLRYDGSTYLQEFLSAYENGEVVVFDTETTGTDVYHDDIIEISAMRVKGGEIVGEPLDLYIQTDKPVPPMLGNKVNPMYALYHEKLNDGTLLAPREALERFLEYVGDRVVLGHNVRFDYHILDHNLRRYVGRRLAIPQEKAFDTLKMMRLLDTGLTSYKLETLIAKLGLQGKNTHRAIDDVGATVSLMRYCAASAKSRVGAQRDFISHPRVKPFVNLLRANYGELYLSGVERLYDLREDGKTAVVEELLRAYGYFLKEQRIGEIPQLDDISRYIIMDMLPRADVPNSLEAQLGRYVMDMNTLKESDFCNSRSIREDVYVTTVHKAKGLEFDNVIVFDAVDGRYPNVYNHDKAKDMEDARKFYVALSRAKRRILVAYSMTTIDRHGLVHPRQLTPFMDEIMADFG